MKSKKVLTVVLIVVLIGAVCAVAYLSLSNNAKKETTTSSEIISSETTSKPTTSSTTKQTTSQPTTQDKTAFIKKGCWYFADREKEVCYAFDFNEGGTADLAMFNSENLEGFDARYFEGYADYEITENKIVFKKLPSGMEIKTIELELGESSILYKNEKLKQFDEISLENAMKCF